MQYVNDKTEFSDVIAQRNYWLRQVQRGEVSRKDYREAVRQLCAEYEALARQRAKASASVALSAA